MTRLRTSRIPPIQGALIGVMAASAAAVVTWYALDQAQIVDVHARIAQAGGWSPMSLSATVGEPLRLRLTADDMPHGFAVGQTDWPAIDLKPGAPVETTLTFERPGTYTFYCTKWCGMGHWRMRGTIEVSAADSAAAAGDAPVTNAVPLYAQLGIDLDAAVQAPPEMLPPVKPSAERGAALPVAGSVPSRNQAALRATSPLDVWRALRQEASLAHLNDSDLWDLVAHLWRAQTSPASLQEGKALYAANCAVCHGELGGGDGIAAAALTARNDAAGLAFGHMTMAPTDFTDPAHMLALSPARLQGKIIRGGMGTGMPFWGPIFTEPQTWALTDYLWTFVFDDL